MNRRIPFFLAFILAVPLFSSLFGQIEPLLESAPVYSDTLTAPITKVWSALLITLAQQEIAVKQFDKEAKRITTDFVYLSSSKKSEVAGNRMSYMGSWDKTLAQWKKIRYSFDIGLSEIDSTHTKVQLLSKLYIYEDNTTNVWHRFYSLGKLEQHLVTKIRENLNEILYNQDMTIPNTIDLIFSYGLASGKLEKTFTESLDDIWGILLHIVRDNSLETKYTNQAEGVILTNYVPFSKEQLDLYFTKDLLTPIKGWAKIWEWD